ncbi:hypothetical protein BH11BAC7_BH11BAC7_35910 [soil metagenome]
MTDEQKLKEIMTLLTFLQSHIQNNVKQSFNDQTFNLETFLTDFLNVFEKDSEKYKNVNSLQHNYPAIDLVNEAKDIAVQITTNADLAKVKKTIATFQKHKLKYSTLIVIGFVNATQSKIPNVTVYGFDYLLKLVKHSGIRQKDVIYEILKRQIPWNGLTPLDDKMCFDIVFDVINRSAVRDYTMCEGDFDKMAQGLFEIKEIITTGIIKDKSIRAKALVEYTDKVKSKLSEIEFYVSSILQICNSNKNARDSDFLCLSREETDKIDEFKSLIIDKTNSIADSFNLNKTITGSRRW